MLIGYLSGGEDGDIVLIDHPRLLFDLLWVLLLLQVLAGQPEENVLLAVLAPQKLPEHASPAYTVHTIDGGAIW